MHLLNIEIIPQTSNFSNVDEGNPKQITPQSKNIVTTLDLTSILDSQIVK